MQESPILTLYSRLLSLKLLPRTGWLQRGVAQPESVAEHTFGVAALALLLGDTLPGLDRGKLLSIALLHDMAEALMGDMPASAMRFLSRGAKKEAERQAFAELVAGLPQADEYLRLWQEYAEGSSAEARLVKQLDRLEMLVQALAYEQAGNRSLAEFWDAPDAEWSDEFPAVQALARELAAKRET
ncbi:MAG: HD domain-containing protein [Chloroflexaceae bacterium]|jgi:putative hydrolase of HD superfamily|nr:HD domain-containing protein [Chloroflexaceae bacterium]